MPVIPVNVAGEDGQLVEDPFAMHTVPVRNAWAGGVTVGRRKRDASRTSARENRVLEFNQLHSIFSETFSLPHPS